MAEPRSRERGVALLVAMLAMALLTVMVMEFTFATQVDLRRAARWTQARQAEVLCQGGVALVEELLNQYGTGPLLGQLLESIRGRAVPVPVPEDVGGSVEVRIDDLSGMIDFNGLGSHTVDGRVRPRKDRKENLERFLNLMVELDVDPAIAGTLIDWTDLDTNVNDSPWGAEEGYYRSLEPAYGPRNAPLRSFGELALVKGFDAGVLVRLRPHTAVLRTPSHVRAGLAADPEPERRKVNVNTASEPVLRAALRTLSPAADYALLAQRLVARRRLIPFSKVGDLEEIDGMEIFEGQDLGRAFRFDSTDFRVLVTAQVEGVLRSIEAVLHRADNGIRVQYWLSRRGPNIPEADDTASSALETLAPPPGQGEIPRVPEP